MGPCPFPLVNQFHRCQLHDGIFHVVCSIVIYFFHLKVLKIGSFRTLLHYLSWNSYTNLEKYLKMWVYIVKLIWWCGDRLKPPFYSKKRWSLTEFWFYALKWFLWEEVPLARGRRAILGHFASWNLWRREIYKEDQEIYGCV